MQEKDVHLKDVLSFVFSLWKANARLVLTNFFIVTVAVVVDVFIPYVGGRLIDSMTVAQDDLDTALIALGVFILLLFVLNSLKLARDFFWIKVASRIMKNLLDDSFFKVQRHSFEWHSNSFSGATVRKVARGMWGYDSFADKVFFDVYQSFLVLMGISLLIGYHWFIMGVMVFSLSILLAATSIFLNLKVIGPAFQISNKYDSRMNGLLADSITCNATVKSFGAEDLEDKSFQEATQNWKEKTSRSWWLSSCVAMAQGGLMLLLVGAMLGMAVWLWSTGNATPGQVTFVMTSCFLVISYLRGLGMSFRGIQQAVNDMEDIVRFVQETNLENDEKGIELSVKKGSIKFDHVGFSYEGKKKVYDDFNLEIMAGEKIGLVGSSGGGKSTLVKLIQRLYDIDTGKIFIDGVDISTVRHQSLRKNIALVPQDPILFHRTLRENIAYAKPDASMDEIVSAAKKAHVHDFIESLADGYDTVVGERGVKLSGGERQRVAIARAFLADAPILILDEATSSLDSVSEKLIQKALAELVKRRTVIVIAHRLSTLQHVDRILLIDHGRIVEQGTHTELMQIKDGQYKELYTVQLGGFDDYSKTLKKKA